MSNEITVNEDRQQSSALTQIESSRAVQEVQAALIIAKRFPRDERAALDKIINACTRPNLAKQAVYQYAKGGQDITGPSIRLAEAMAQSWGNLQFGWKELDRFKDAEGVNVSVVEAFAWDVESNTRIPRVFNVRHWRDKKNGQGYKIVDERDIYELCANMAARRVRACILSIIPGDIAESALDQCDATLAAEVNITPKAISNLLEGFAKYGVTKEHVEKRIQRRMDAITAAQVLNLIKIGNSLKDGMSTAKEWFEMEEETPVPKTNKPNMGSAPKKKEAVRDNRSLLASMLEFQGVSVPDALRQMAERDFETGGTLADTPDGTITEMLSTFGDKEDEIP